MKQPAALPYVLPFAVFLALLGLGSVWPLKGVADQVARIAVMATVLLWVSRPVLDFRVRYWTGTLLVGGLIFVLWIAPDLLFPNYRHSLVFNNPVVGSASSSLSEAVRHEPAVLFLRSFRASIVVPIVEELFWRGWLMRWMIAADFRRIPLGSYTGLSFWVVAVLFASEHGPYWDVGLVAGVVFNLWMIRTRSLGDLMLAHAITNACLSAYVIAAGKWEYWL